MSIEVSTLNDTLEEELRRLLVDKNNECQSLKNTIKLLEQNIKEEQDQKYRAYVKISDLQNKLKKQSQ